MVVKKAKVAMPVKKKPGRRKSKWGFGRKWAPEKLVRKYLPLVYSIARKKFDKYPSVTIEELAYEGEQILYWLIPMCKKLRQLRGFLKIWLPVYMERAAQWLTWRDEPWDMKLDGELEERYLRDPSDAELVEEAELRALLWILLPPREYRLAILLWHGHTKEEAGQKLGISRRTVHSRLRIIQDILRPVFYPAA